MTPTVSVIIPALNERQALPGTVARARLCFPKAEILVADGGSVDGTREWVEASGQAMLVSCERGRGPQMNAGAGAATGDILLFLHADCLLPITAAAAMGEIMADLSVVGGAFSLGFAEECAPKMRRMAGLVNLRSHIVREASGDQGIFVRREVFAAAGGFPEWPLFEDFALAARVRARGGFRVAGARVIVSPRRWEAHGFWRTCALMCLLYGGFRAGMAPATLKRWFVDVRPKGG